MYSLKAKRRATIFGVRALEQWIALEANPAVKLLCERPLIIRDTRPHRVVDFWASGDGFSKFILLTRDSEAKSAEKRRVDLAAFRAWAADAGCTIEELPQVQTAPAKARWLANWTSVLQHLGSYQSYLPSNLVRRVEDQLSDRRSIRKVQAGIPDVEPEIVRVAVYLLVHCGSHRFVDLESQLLSDDFEVERV